MKSRLILLATLLTASGASALHAQKLYGPDFGLSSPIIATGNQVIATYYGWEQSTVFGDQIYALTVDQYELDLSNNCFNFYAQDRTGCQGSGNTDLGLLSGDDLFGKPQGVSCPDLSTPCLASPVTATFGWTAGTEIVFALMVDQGQGDYNWFFSGDPTRNNNADGGDGGHAHLAYFDSADYPDGIPAYNGVFVPGTAGTSLYGWEDVGYQNSDWDFNNAIFAIDANTISTPQSATPEPGTMTLLATGLLSLGAAATRRRRGTARRA